MKRHRRKHTGEFKAKVALEAIRGIKTTSEIAQEYEIHPVMVSKWKKELLEHLPEVFDSKTNSRKEKTVEKEKEQLHRKVGQLTMEVDFLEKKCKQLGIPGKDRNS